MTKQIVRRVLVYKRTHIGDPDRYGCFGSSNCMGTIRSRDYAAVVGVGGLGREPHNHDIAGKVNWIGIGPHKIGDRRRPLVSFDHFLNLDTIGPDFKSLAPNLAKRMYDRNVRHVIRLSEPEYREIASILKLAERAPPSHCRVARRKKCGPAPSKKKNCVKSSC